MKKKLKILIATGGTGGHIYPAIALAEQLIERSPESEVLFVGGGLSTNRYFNSKAFASQTVSCGTFIKKSPLEIAKTIFNIGRGVWQSRRIIQEFKPDIAVGFGSYYSFPPLLAAKWLSCPFILHEANSIPGKVNKLLAPLAEKVGVHFPETVKLLKGNIIEVGMPLRNGFKRSNVNKEEARKYFNLPGDCLTLLVFGGSQGANRINELLLSVTEKIKKLSTEVQIIHFTGSIESEEIFREHYKKHGIFASVKSFETNMQMAWQAADLLVARSGAGTIAEQLEFEVPGILIPYPSAADNHQEHNADFMVLQVGGGIKLREKELTDDCFIQSLETLLCNKGAKLIKMRESMINYKQKARTKNLCSLVFEVIGDINVK